MSGRRILISPSILAADFSRLGEEIRLVESAGADMIHVDVMDGHFVPNITLGPVIVEAINDVTELPIDAHLMITDPETYAPAFIDAGADYVVFHSEACEEPPRLIELIRARGARPGLAVNPPNPPERIRPYLADIDLALVMTVNPGFAGQSFIADVVPKIATVAQWKRASDLDLLIQVDGGINRDTAQEVARAGADVIVAASAIFGAPDAAAELAAIRKAAEDALS
jgi:ribulose-phosphate 3-epimerase